MGVSLAGITKHAHASYHGISTTETPVAVEVQTIIVQVTQCVLGSMLYQAFMEIGICIASPFASESRDGAIPVTRLTLELERDLKDQHQVASNCLHWDQPFFKPRAVKD